MQSPFESVGSIRSQSDWDEAENDFPDLEEFVDKTVHGIIQFLYGGSMGHPLFRISSWEGRELLKLFLAMENNCRICHERMVVKERCMKKNPKGVKVA